MKRPRILKGAFRNILAARQRSLLALLGITVGIGSVIAMVSIGASARAEAEAQFRALGTDLFSVQVMTAQLAGPPRGRIAALESLPRTSGAATAIAAVAFLKGPVRARGKTLDQTVVLGVSKGFFDVSRARALHGRLLTPLDADSRFCVLGSKLSETLSPVGASGLVGSEVLIGERAYTVVGVLAPAPRSRLTNYTVDETAIVPIEIATRASSETVAFALGRLGPRFSFQTAARHMEGILLRGGLSATIKTTEELVEQMERQTRLFTLLLGAIGAIALVVGGVGVMNVMLSSVTERTREIGLLRALGARRGTIQELFVAEALLLGAIGGCLGVVTGITAARIVCHYSGWPFQLSLVAIATGVTLAMATAVFFGSFPARQAARIHPMTVLR